MEEEEEVVVYLSKRELTVRIPPLRCCDERTNTLANSVVATSSCVNGSIRMFAYAAGILAI